MSKSEQLWRSLENEEYRKAFIVDDTGLAFQIKLLREKNGWTQAQLAASVGSRQETISQWENPNYGRYSLKTLKGLAIAFDVGLNVRFSPFSELVEWNANLTPERLAPPSFTEEQHSRRAPVIQSYEVHTGEPEIIVAYVEGADRPLSFTATLPLDDSVQATLDWVSTTTAEPKENKRALAA